MNSLSQDDYDIKAAYEHIVESRGISDQELADYMKVSEKTALDWITGKTIIGEGNARRLCNFFDISYKHFILLGRYINYFGHADGWPEKDIYFLPEG